MRVAIGQFKELIEERLRFAAQLGASGVLLNTPILPGMQHWDYADLLWLRTRCEGHGLRLEALENVPISFYDKAMLGLPGRDEQIEHYQTTIRNMGRAELRGLRTITRRRVVRDRPRPRAQLPAAVPARA